MLGALRQIDAVALAQCIESVWAGGMAPSRQRQRVDDAVEREQGPRKATKLGVEEAQVEGGVVRHQRRIADESQELVGHILEERLALQEIRGEAVDGDGIGMDIALGVEIAVELAACWNAVDDLDATKLDQAIAARGIETRRLGIQHDLAQHSVSPMPIREHFRSPSPRSYGERVGVRGGTKRRCSPLAAPHPNPLPMLKKHGERE